MNNISLYDSVSFHENTMESIFIFDIPQVILTSIFVFKFISEN